MKSTYHKVEGLFEKLTAIATAILGSSFTFIVVLIMIFYFLTNEEFRTQERQHQLRDVIHAVTFLSLFIIQKEFNRFSGAIHLKINELVVSNKKANNAVINMEQKTEQEIIELTKEYTELAEIAEKEINDK